MNEQIQQMIFSLNDKVGVHWTHEDKIKFAELIVRECANAAYQSLYEDRIFDDSPHIIRTKVMDDIKKHLGVE